MRAYHFDKNHSLKENMIINLQKNDFSSTTDKLFDSNEYSHFGKKFCIPKRDLLIFDNANSITSFSIEHNYEVTRKSDFPEKPCRYKSFFAVKNPKDLLLWHKFFPITPDSVVWEIEFDHNKFHYADASFLKELPVDLNPSDPNFFNINLEVYQAKMNYWNGVFSDNPLPELVIELPVKVKRQIDINDIIS